MIKLPSEYRFHRQQGATAQIALAKARADIEAKKSRYPASGFCCWQNATGKDGGKWFENPEKDGFRLVGFADEIASRNYRYSGGINHKGWFTNEFQDETLRGLVYQLPARNGKPQFVPGYADPDNEGAARLWLGDIIEGDNGEDEQSKRDAAYRADSIAERCAEKEREYNEAWQAGNRASDLDEAAAQARKELLAFLRELKPKKPLFCDAPTLAKAARRKVEDLLETIRKCRAKRDRMIDDCASWAREAFNEGYGRNVA